MQSCVAVAAVPCLTNAASSLQSKTPPTVGVPAAPFPTRHADKLVSDQSETKHLLELNVSRRQAHSG